MPFRVVHLLLALVLPILGRFGAGKLDPDIMIASGYLLFKDVDACVCGSFSVEPGDSDKSVA